MICKQITVQYCVGSFGTPGQLKGCKAAQHTQAVPGVHPVRYSMVQHSSCQDYDH